MYGLRCILLVLFVFQQVYELCVWVSGMIFGVVFEMSCVDK